MVCDKHGDQELADQEEVEVLADYAFSFLFFNPYLLDRVPAVLAVVEFLFVVEDLQSFEQSGAQVRLGKA